MTVLTHVVACDGQKAKLIAILDKIALLHKTTNFRSDRRDEESNRMDVTCFVIIAHVVTYDIVTHVVACDGQQAKLIAILEQIALRHTNNKYTYDRQKTEDVG
jgi:NAD kinase